MDTKNEEEETRKVDFEPVEIEYVSYGGEHHLPLIMSLVDQELSEPYSIFTYRYFVYLWPQLSFLVTFHSYLLWCFFQSLQTLIDYFSFFCVCVCLCVWFSVYGFQAFHQGKCVGTVVCKMGQHRNTFRGYIAMLVVIKPYRSRGIGNFPNPRHLPMKKIKICGIYDFQSDPITAINFATELLILGTQLYYDKFFYIVELKTF